MKSFYYKFSFLYTLRYLSLNIIHNKNYYLQDISTFTGKEDNFFSFCVSIVL